MTQPALQPLFAPRSIAVYGASLEPGTLGNRAIMNLLNGGFSGAVIPINPRHAGLTLNGLSWYGSATEHPDRIDHAVLLVRANLVETAVQDAIDAGVRSISILSGGFAEMGEDGNALQARVEELVRQAGIPILGPNCLGFVNTSAGVYASPGSVFEVVWPQGGPLAIISQSGAIAADILARARQAGIESSCWFSTGNEIGVTAADCIEYACGIEEVRAIAVYIESIKDVNAFRRAAAKARSMDKQIVLIRPGRTQAGVSAVKSHTAALVTADRLYDALFREIGIVRVDSQRELIDVIQTFAFVGRPDGGLAIVSSSGGSGAMTADAAAGQGVRLASISNEGQKALRKLVPNCAASNPIDITGAANQTPAILDPFFSVVLNEPDVDMMVMIHGASMMWRDRAEKITETLVRLAKSHSAKRIMFVGEVEPDLATRLTAAGVMVFDDSVALMRALAHLTSGEKIRSTMTAPASAATRTGHMLSESEALDFVEESVGVPVVARSLVTSAAQACAAADKLGYPVAMKAVLPGVAHKTEMGAVRIDIRDRGHVEETWASLAALSRAQGVEPRILVEEMAENVVAELLVSAFVDPLLGPFVTVGAGGTLTEILNDIAVAVAPVTDERAAVMIDSLKSAKYLEKSRSGLLGNTPELIQAIVRVSNAIGSNSVKHREGVVSEIEINPFMLRESGSCAVDAVVIVSQL